MASISWTIRAYEIATGGLVWAPITAATAIETRAYLNPESSSKIMAAALQGYTQPQSEEDRLRKMKQMADEMPKGSLLSSSFY